VEEAKVSRPEVRAAMASAIAQGIEKCLN
jgi:hypothetical protein